MDRSRRKWASVRFLGAVDSDTVTSELESPSQRDANTESEAPHPEVKCTEALKVSFQCALRESHSCCCCHCGQNLTGLHWQLHNGRQTGHPPSLRQCNSHVCQSNYSSTVRGKLATGLYNAASHRAKTFVCVFVRRWDQSVPSCKWTRCVAHHCYFPTDPRFACLCFLVSVAARLGHMIFCMSQCRKHVCDCVCFRVLAYVFKSPPFPYVSFFISIVSLSFCCFTGNLKNVV